ncbi:Protein DCL-like, chloroplastic, partial [Mucuna pruriens]
MIDSLQVGSLCWGSIVLSPLTVTRYEIISKGPNPTQPNPSLTMAYLLLRQALLLRVCLHNYQRFTDGAVAARHRPWCSAAANLPSDEAEEKTISGSISNRSNARKGEYRRWEDEPDYRQWKDKEEEILRDVEPVLLLAKDILHSRRYMDGERLSVEDEKVVVERLLAYHPQSEDKIGCGLESIMTVELGLLLFEFACQRSALVTLQSRVNAGYGYVDRHPQFRQSRCLFVVRTDGGWIDFSYQKCLRKYIRDKYPTYAERFIRQHFKRGSGCFHSECGFIPRDLENHHNLCLRVLPVANANLEEF